MYFKIYEKYNMVILIVLVLLSFVQVGFLWKSRAHGIPYFANKSQSINIDNLQGIEKLIMPNKIIISNGQAEDHWMIYSDSLEYKSIWEDVKSYLRDILIDSKIYAIEEYTDDSWSKKLRSKSYLCEFNIPMDSSLFGTFLGIENQKDFIVDKIFKIILLPYEGISNKIIIGLYDGDSKVYYYELEVNKNGLDKNDYDELINNLQYKTNVKKFNFISEVLPSLDKGKFKINPAMKVFVEDSQFNFYDIYINMRFKVYDINKISKSQIQAIKKSLLGVDDESYDNGIDEANRAIVFSNLSNLYKYNHEGIFEYRYLLNRKENILGKSVSLKALEKAYSFVNSKDVLNEYTNIVLTKFIENKQGEYEISFNYSIDNINVHILNEKGEKLDAIVMKVKNDKVISCKWIIKNLYMDKDKANVYDIGFISILDKVNKMSEEKVFIDDLEFVYKIKHEELNKYRNIIAKITTDDEEIYINPDKTKGEK